MRQSKSKVSTGTHNATLNAKTSEHGTAPRRRIVTVVIMTFTCPCIANIIPNYDQQDTTFLDLFISTDSLSVSGGFSAHHQEHINVHTAHPC